MQFYKFGKKENPVIFLFPGTCCHWKANFGEVIPLLEDRYYVVGVSYDGFDEMEEEQDYYRKMLVMFGIGSSRMAFVKKKSIRNQFYSDLVTPLENAISVPGTTVHCFYAVKMGVEYEKRYRQHFKSPDIRRHDLQHEELLMRYPNKWMQEIFSCCGIEGVEEKSGRMRKSDMA